MKRRLLLTFIGLAVSFMAMAQSKQNRTNPDDAQYFIKGNLSIEKGANGQTVYKLSEIDNQGIYFDDPDAIRSGEPTLLEDVLFQFSRASTDYPGGIETPLDFWRYDNSINEWQPDMETRQGTAGVEEKKSMVGMLVIDCSSSIGSDFENVKNAAKDFVKFLYDASKGTGNIKLGIVCFSKINETRVFDIRPLTYNSYMQMDTFINNRKPENGTALYYAVDKVVELMNAYCEKSISPNEPLSAAFMVTFTDGLDQTSRNPDKNILTADNYYDELLSKYGAKMQNIRIKDISLQHEIRGVKGNDIISEAQLGKFSRIGESLGNFKLLNNYSELGEEFAAIAQNLINQWRILNLYVPNSFSGRVAWTYPGQKKKDKPKLAFLRLPLFGLNVGGGGGYSKPTQFLEFSVGLDFAVACGPKFAMGLYGSYKTSFITFHQGAVGLDFMFGPQQKAFLLGLGCEIRNRDRAEFYSSEYFVERTTDFDVGLDMRLGGVFKGFYFFFDFSVEPYNGYDEIKRSTDRDRGFTLSTDRWLTILPQATFNIGINFTQLGKKNKNNQKKQQ